MIKIHWSATEIQALQYWRFHHPDPRVQVRMEALYLRSQGVATGAIPRLCGIPKASFHRSLNAYVTGGSHSCNASLIIVRSVNSSTIVLCLKRTFGSTPRRRWRQRRPRSLN